MPHLHVNKRWVRIPQDRSVCVWWKVLSLLFCNVEFNLKTLKYIIKAPEFQKIVFVAHLNELKSYNSVIQQNEYGFVVNTAYYLPRM